MVTERHIEEHSPTWRAVKSWAEGVLEISRARIEACGTPQDVTEFERGRIAACKELLALTAPKPVTTYSASAE